MYDKFLCRLPTHNFINVHLVVIEIKHVDVQKDRACKT